ncbi:MAG: ABC-F family ATP-binding cassette domain-containing protein [Candidatus Methanomethylophilaceae archaeon]|nr:ABC-F family ATP-binding cassette domain-containing protein [Candidatus Methanomethylophilaceae archaeon]
MLIRAEAITKAFGQHKVLNRADLQINEGDAIGLIGINGAGKSTFMKILLGEEKQDTGEIIRNTQRIGYLAQFDESSDCTVREVLGRPYGHVEHLRRRQVEIDEIMAQGGDIDWNALAEESAKIEKALNESDSKDEEKQIDSLKKVGLSRSIMDRKMSTLSGGERTKVMLSRIFVQAEGCDMLFMDEPTNHLDIETVESLEDFILETHCAILVVSHDRYFMDKVVTRVTEISHGKTIEYKGNYSQFVMKKQLDFERMEKEYRRYTIQKREQEKIAAEMHKDQWFMALHKTRQKMIDRMDVKEKPEADREITVRIQAAKKSGKNVFKTKGLSVELGGKMILENIDLDIDKGEKIGIFGANGEGKSTLVKALLEEIPSKGELWVAPGAKIGYFAQQHENLDLELTAEEQLMLILGKDRRPDIRKMLGRFFLYGEKVERPMSTLSGGERARVALAVLLLDEYNVLVLDEPTNYLDIPARHAVEQALNEYDGTILAVTHDRYFLDTVCTKVIEVKDHHIKVFNGTYSAMKGRPNTVEIVMDADEYRVVSSFTNWATGRKFSSGDKVLIAPAEMKNYEWAIGQGKLKKTGGRQRKKVDVSTADKKDQ